MKLDEFRSRCPIDIIAKTNPIERLKESVSLLHTLSEQMAGTGEVKGKTGELVQHIPERYFLTVVFHDDLKSIGKISTKYAELFRQCNRCNIPYALNQGILLNRKKKSILSQVFLEVPYPVAGISNLHRVEEGDFTCRVLKRCLQTAAGLHENLSAFQNRTYVLYSGSLKNRKFG